MKIKKHMQSGLLVREDGARQEYDKWKKSLGKFLAKAEEYK